MNVLKSISDLYGNYNDKLFNVTARKKEKKLKIGFSSQGKSTDKFDLTVSSNTLQWSQRKQSKRNKITYSFLIL